MYDEFLRVWKDLGLDLVAVSMYHYDDKKNQEAFSQRTPRPYSLEKLIGQIQSHGLRVRLSCVMLQGYVNNLEEATNLIEFSKKNGVFQLTIRKADRPANPLDTSAASYVDNNRIDSPEFNKELSDFLEKNGKLCDILPHGASVYEVNGQNVCVTTGLSTRFSGPKNRKGSENCLQSKPTDDELRQLIFIPPDMLTTSWENIHGGRIL